MSWLDQHLTAAQPLLDRWGYGAVFVAIGVEGVGIPAPGQTLLMAASLLAARGQLSLGPLLATSVAGAALGNALGWVVGRWGGRPLLERFAGGPRLERIDDLFERRGGLVVLLGRFVDGVRQVNGLAAGALGMPFAPFFAWNLAGALLWTGVWSLGLYWLDRDFEAIARTFHHVQRWIGLGVGILVLLVLAWVVRGHLAEKRDAGDAPASPH